MGPPWPPHPTPQTPSVLFNTTRQLGLLHPGAGLEAQWAAVMAHACRQGGVEGGGGIRATACGLACWALRAAHVLPGGSSPAGERRACCGRRVALPHPLHAPLTTLLSTMLSTTMNRPNNKQHVKLSLTCLDAMPAVAAACTGHHQEQKPSGCCTHEWQAPPTLQ